MHVLRKSSCQGRIVERLGLKRHQFAAQRSSVPQGPTIWLHALSVGEVSSALPLVKGIRRQFGSVRIVFTASTRSGKALAEHLISPHADLVLYSPLDCRFAVRRYLSAIRPDLFILVETDFWPNWLTLLRRQQVPIMLVNGRISAKSLAAYRRFAFFFKPMFRCFDLLAMQTAEERDKMLALGLPAEKVVVLGNLKYDLPMQQAAPPDLAAEQGQLVWVCGSTHPGEEEVIFAAFKYIVGANPCGCPDHSPLQLLLAPRQISRGSELVRLARSFGLAADLRSSGTRSPESRVLILDTIGELAACYSLARLAFIGGSLADAGGHNPIEAAAQGVPVLFGPHTEDFAEIARDLCSCGGAKVVSAESLAEQVAAILSDDALHAAMSAAARQLVEQQRGSVERHLQAVRTLLRQ
ncbi:3-deoxy-D-manno-octulosonic acid transferase [Candidatus Electronema halotolerans]